MRFNQLNKKLFLLSYILFLFTYTFFCFKFHYESVLSTELNAISLSSKSFIIGYLAIPLINKIFDCNFLESNTMYFPLILLSPYFLAHISIYPSVPNSDVMVFTASAKLLMNGLSLTNVYYGGYPSHLILTWILGLVTGIDLTKIYIIGFGLLSYLIIIYIYFISKYITSSNLGTIFYLGTGSLFSYYYFVPATIGLLLFAMIGFYLLRMLTEDNKINWKILLLILIPSIITFHIFSSVFALSVILSVLIMREIFPSYEHAMSYKYTVGLVVLFIISILAYHIYVNTYILPSITTNIKNFFYGQELVIAYNSPSYLGLSDSKTLLIIKKISSLFRWFIALLVILISLNYKKLTKKETESFMPLICIIISIGLCGILFRYFAPSYTLRLTQYLWIYLCILASISAKRFNIISVNHTFILYFFIIIITFFGFIDHANNPQCQNNIQERSCMDTISKFRVDETIVIPPDESTNYYAEDPSNFSKVISFDSSNPLIWEQVYTGSKGGKYFYLTSDEKLDYYQTRYKMKIPRTKIKSFLSNHNLYYNNGESKVYFL